LRRFVEKRASYVGYIYKSLDSRSSPRDSHYEDRLPWSSHSTCRIFAILHNPSQAIERPRLRHTNQTNSQTQTCLIRVSLAMSRKETASTEVYRPTFPESAPPHHKHSGQLRYAAVMPRSPPPPNRRQAVFTRTAQTGFDLSAPSLKLAGSVTP
jgi:hypothetical protein